MGEKSSRPHGIVHSKEMAPEFVPLAAASEPKLLPLLARALLRPLVEHEASCLGYVLNTNQILWRDGSTDEALSVEKCGEILACLCFEYPEEFYRTAGVHDLAKIPLAVKAKYWSDRLNQRAIADEPLHYADQNTILRIRDSLLAQPEISELRFVG